MFFKTFLKMFTSNEMFYFSECVLKFVGFSPIIKKVSLKTKVWAAFNFLMLICAISGEFMHGVLKFNTDLLTALDAICPAITLTVTSLKLLTFFVSKEKFLENIMNVKEMFQEEVDDECKTVIETTFKKVRIYNICLFTFGNLTNFGYFARPIGNNLIAYMNNGQLTRDMPFKVSLPYNITQTPAYQLTYAALNYTGLITICGFVGMDGMFITFCLYLSSQFEVIRRKVRVLITEDLGCFCLFVFLSNVEGRVNTFLGNMFWFTFYQNPNHRNYKLHNHQIIIPTRINNNGFELLSDGHNYLIEQKLREIVRKHVKLITSCDDVVKLFAITIEMHFLSAAIVIGVALLQTVLSNDFGRMLYMFYAISALMQLFVYCIGGSYVIDSSVGIALDINELEWYMLSIKNRRMLQLILLRSQLGARIAVPFFELSLPTFASILSKAGSYIALLKTFL